jgi:transcriptional regulator with XRE-family HTH domain
METSLQGSSEFGEYIKNLRLARRITLRAFAEIVGADPANYSKLERGKLPPPADPTRLEPYRKALGLDSESPEWREAIRLASLDRGELPPRIISNATLMAKLPALFRTLEGEPVDEATLDELVAMLRKEY